MSTTDATLAQLAVTQHGVFSLEDLSALGMSRSARRHRLATGRWIILFDGIYTIAGAPITWHGRLLATCWAGGSQALASHRAAASLWGFPGFPEPPIEITCPRWRRHHTTELIVHETLEIDRQPSSRDGIPVTSATRTLLDLGAVVSPGLVEMALDVALRTRLVTLPDLWRLLADVGRRGRAGTGVLRAILDQRGPQRPTESPQETRLVRLLRRHGFSGFEPQYEIRHERRFVARVDVAFPAGRVAVEYDSYQEHSGSAALVRDTARRNALLAAGWTVVGVTARDLRNFEPVSALLRAAIGASKSARTS